MIQAVPFTMEAEPFSLFLSSMLTLAAMLCILLLNVVKASLLHAGGPS